MRTSTRRTVASEPIVVVHDDVRLFVAGNPALPVGDIEVGGDPEDAGNKGFSYRCAPVHPRVGLEEVSPSTPQLVSAQAVPTWLRVVCAADKPRMHTFTVHGVDTPQAPWVADSPRIGSLSGVAGDHVYRSGAFQWAVEQGAWGMLKVR